MLLDNLDNRLNDNASSIEVEIFNTIIGYEENQKNESKKKRSERLCAARKAIEVHCENKALAKYLGNDYIND